MLTVGARHRDPPVPVASGWRARRRSRASCTPPAARRRTRAARPRAPPAANSGAASRSTSHGASSPSAERQPAAEQRRVRQHVGERPPRLGSLLERVGERRPRGAERELHEHHRARDLDADRVQADLVLVDDPAEQQPVGEVDDPDREPGRQQRQPEPVHPPHELAVEGGPRARPAAARSAPPARPRVPIALPASAPVGAVVEHEHRTRSSRPRSPRGWRGSRP